MARPTNKAEFIAAATSEFDRLWIAVESVPSQHRTLGGACDAWSVKDLLAHLNALHEMAIGWEQAGQPASSPRFLPRVIRSPRRQP